jgi:hypothetical protein
MKVLFQTARRFVAVIMIASAVLFSCIYPNVVYGNGITEAFLATEVKRSVSWEDPLGMNLFEMFLDRNQLANPQYDTSTDSPFESNYRQLLTGSSQWSSFRTLNRSLYKTGYYLIPGISNTNLGEGTTSRMVPQGICVAGQFVLISAYNFAKPQKYSCIYVLNKNTREYITTLVLNIKSHVGALTYGGGNDGNIYIADSNHFDPETMGSKKVKIAIDDAKYRVWKLPVSEVVKAVKTKEDSVKVKLTDYLGVSVRPSFLCSYKGTLFVGDINNREGGSGKSFMQGYSMKTGEINVQRIDLDSSTQGVAITEYKGKLYLLSSRSFGRNYPSILTIRRIYHNRIIGWVPSFFTVREIALPNMSEDVDVHGDHVLINFESASKKYQKRNVTQRQMDRVINASLGSLIEGYPLMIPLKDNHLPEEYGTYGMSEGETSLPMADHFMYAVALPKKPFRLADGSDDR